MDIENIAQLLSDGRYKRGAKGWINFSCICPGHEDSNYSFGIKQGDRAVIWKCHANCSDAEIMDELKRRGLGYLIGGDSMEAVTYIKDRKTEYVYVNAEGKPLYKKIKFMKNGEKSYYFQHKNEAGEWQKGRHYTQVPYNFKAISEADEGSTIFLVEGEKDADRLISLGLLATTVGSVADWSSHFAQYFKKHFVIIIPDRDIPGQTFGKQAAEDLAIGSRVKIWDLDYPIVKKKGKDVSDYIDELEVDNRDRYASTKELLTSIYNHFYRTSEELPFYVNDKIEYAPENVPSMTNVPDEVIFPHITSRGNPRLTKENLQAILTAYELGVRYNEMKKRVEIDMHGLTDDQGDYENTLIGQVNSIANRHGFSSKQHVMDYLNLIGRDAPFNPVSTWIESKEWDGKSRLDEIVATLNPDDYEYAHAAMKRWLLSGIAAIYCPQGVDADGCIVLQGKQGAGKTPWMWSLVGGKYSENRAFALEGHRLTMGTTATLTAISYWIVEIGELGQTLNSQTNDWLKAFISKQTDEENLKYQPRNVKFPRRTIFMGTVNEAHFLVDRTGNKRWWVINTDNVNWDHDVDVQQLWAEFKVRWEAGESHRLTDEDKALIEIKNEQFMDSDPLEDLLLSTFDFEQQPNVFLSSTEICKECGMLTVSRSDATSMANIVTKMLKTKSRKLKGKRGYFMPPKFPYTYTRTNP